MELNFYKYIQMIFLPSEIGLSQVVSGPSQNMVMPQNTNPNTKPFANG